MTLLDKIKIIRSYWPVSKYYFYSLLKKNQPLFGLFFQITDRCNARCLMCFNWQKINKIEDELSINEIAKFTKNMGPVPRLSLGGGEPFLRDDLAEICRLFYNNNQTRKIVIPTNCLLPDRIIILTEKALKLCPIKIKIVLSLDGIGKIHNQIRGVDGAFDKVLETYKKLIILSKKYPELQIGLNTTISNKNENHIREVIDYVDNNLKVKFHTIELIRGGYNQKNVSAPSCERYEKIIKQILMSKTINNDKYYKITYSYFHKIALKILRQKKQLIPCRISSFMPVIDATGSVYNCELLPKIGNLKDADFNFLRVWNSNVAKRQRKDIANKKCYCTHYCYQIQNIVISPYHFFRAISKQK